MPATVATATKKAAPRAGMTTYNRSFWEERWSPALREHPDRVAHRPPNAHLSAEVKNLRPGFALEAGCGHGSDTLWLAARGWQVIAVDFSATALAYARSPAEAWGRTSPSASTGYGLRAIFTPRSETFALPCQ